MKHEIGVAGFNILYRKICSAAYAFIPQLGSHTHTQIKLKKEKNEKNVGQVIPPPSASPSDFAREGHTAHYYGSCCFGYLVISPK